jgi:hypothetical protein
MIRPTRHEDEAGVAQSPAEFHVILREKGIIFMNS